MTDMKKVLLFLFAAIMVVLPSCNDDDAYDNKDARLTAALPGYWVLEEQGANMRTTVTYQFTAAGTFTYSYTTDNSTENTHKVWSVSGTWNVKKETLQLKYDLSSFVTTGYSDAEVRGIRTSLIDGNSALEESNKQDKVYGPTIEIVSTASTARMTLSSFSGVFTKK